MSMHVLNSITTTVLKLTKDKILMGAKRKNAVITPRAGKYIAYHEAGYALVGVLTAGVHPIHKATIILWRNSLGMVIMLHERDQTS